MLRLILGQGRRRIENTRGTTPEDQKSDDSEGDCASMQDEESETLEPWLIGLGASLTTSKTICKNLRFAHGLNRHARGNGDMQQNTTRLKLKTILMLLVLITLTIDKLFIDHSYLYALVSSYFIVLEA